jgi:DNA-binding GntR family transcriptional regulator
MDKAYFLYDVRIGTWVPGTRLPWSPQGVRLKDVSSVADQVRPRMAPIARSVLSDGTYGSIRSLILNHHIHPGARISIDALSRELGVSQTPVREALARLESDGLVVKIPLRGYAATDLLTLDQFNDLFAFRELIEPWSASHAASTAAPQDVAALLSEVDAGERIVADDDERAYPSLVEHDTRFHMVVSRLSGNVLVSEAWDRSHCQLHLYRLHQGGKANRLSTGFYSGDRVTFTVEEHRRVAEAIANGEADQAEREMLRHVRGARERFQPVVDALYAK